jgi:hypothetical protein
MFKFNRTPVLARNVITFMAISGASVPFMVAQTPTTQTPVLQAPSTLDLRVPALDMSSAQLFSSSTDGDTAPAAVASLHPMVPNFAEAMQYGGGQRKRYGRPRYRGANTNADGSSKYIFYGGVGLVQPIGNTYHYLTPSYGIQVGGGRQFNKHFSVPIEFDYDHFGMTGQTIGNQELLYNTIYGEGVADGLDGNSHVWSFSVDPTYTFYSGEGLGAYVVAGVGFYHKVANFTLPQEEEYCDYYCEDFVENENIDHYTSNAPGFSGGIGLTYKFSRFANERFYIEARYVFVDNSQRYGYTVNDIVTSPVAPTFNASNPDPNNLYPANSNRTTYIPIKVGIRF